MKFGIVGGIGPASTVDYYSGIIGDLHKTTGEYPLLTVESINMTEMCGYFADNDYDAAASLICGAIENLKRAGADAAAVASNTPHIVFDRIRENSSLPLISIVDAVCGYASEKGVCRALILGTEFTMKSGMYSAALEGYGIECAVPSESDIEKVQGIIFPNLEDGIVIASDKERMISIAEKYILQCCADAVILGCTEIPLMIKQGDLSVPCINTTEVHINAITEFIRRNG